MIKQLARGHSAHRRPHSSNSRVVVCLLSHTLSGNSDRKDWFCQLTVQIASKYLFYAGALGWILKWASPALTELIYNECSTVHQKYDVNHYSVLNYIPRLRW